MEILLWCDSPRILRGDRSPRNFSVEKFLLDPGILILFTNKISKFLSIPPRKCFKHLLARTNEKDQPKLGIGHEYFSGEKSLDPDSVAFAPSVFRFPTKAKPLAFSAAQIEKAPLRVLFLCVRAGGIELPPTAWKAVILPLNYARELKHISIF